MPEVVVIDPAVRDRIIADYEDEQRRLQEGLGKLGPRGAPVQQAVAQPQPEQQAQPQPQQGIGEVAPAAVSRAASYDTAAAELEARNIPRTVMVNNPLAGPAREVGKTSVAAQEATGKVAGYEMAASAAQKFDEARSLQGVAEDMQRRTEMFDAREYARQERIAKSAIAQQRVQSMIANLAKQQEEGSQIDPGRYWADKPAGIKFLMATAVIAKSLSRSFQTMRTGQSGPNEALEAIRNAIDRDVQAQKDSFAQRGQAIEARLRQLGALDNMYGRLIEQGFNDQQAMNMATAARWEQAKLAIDAEAKRFGGAVDQIKLEEVRATADAEIAKAKFAATALEMQQPAKRAVSVGPSPAEAAQNERLAKEYRDRAAKLEEMGFKTAADYEKEAAQSGSVEATAQEFKRDGINPKEGWSFVADYGKSKAAIKKARFMVDEFLTTYGSEDSNIPGVGGQITQRVFGGDLSGGGWAGGAKTKEADRAMRMIEQTFNVYKVATTGASGQVTEREDIKNALFGAGTEDSIRDAFRLMQKDLDKTEANVENSYADSVRQAWARNPNLPKAEVRGESPGAQGASSRQPYR